MKLEFSLLPIPALRETVRAFQDGNANGYERDDYLTNPRLRWSIEIDGALRHITSFWAGEEWAKDSGVHHLAHAIARLMILLTLVLLHRGIDDRPRYGDDELQ